MSDEETRREERLAAAGEFSRRRLVELTRLAGAIEATRREAERALDLPARDGVPLLPEHVRGIFSVEAALGLRHSETARLLVEVFVYSTEILSLRVDQFWDALSYPPAWQPAVRGGPGELLDVRLHPEVARRFRASTFGESLWRRRTYGAGP